MRDGSVLRRLCEFVNLSEAETQAVRDMLEPPIRLPRHRPIRRQGEAPHCVYMLREGWVGAIQTLADGRQQMLKLHLPGDMLGSPSICLLGASETLLPLTPVTVCPLPHHALMSLFTTAPRVAAAMFLSAQKERVALMDAMTAIGRSGARERVARVLVDLFVRLSATGLVEDGGFDMPLTQDQMSDLVAMTPVHLNRIIQPLRAEGLVEWQHGRMRLPDIEGLMRVSRTTPRDYVSEPSWFPKRPQTATGRAPAAISG